MSEKEKANKEKKKSSHAANLVNRRSPEKERWTRWRGGILGLVLTGQGRARDNASRCDRHFW
jgi:hypothetical protein